MANQEQTKTNYDNQKVLITRTMAVHPRSPLPQQKFLHLSNLDRKCPQLMYLVFFYRSSPPHNMLFNSLKQGLEDTLSAWFPAAGRLIINPDNGKLDLLCDNNSGVLLVEAFTKIHISELGDLSQYNEFFERLVVNSPFSADNLSEMPLLVAQVTRFGCGGYSVGVGTSHSIFDGVANYNFVKAWAYNTTKRAGKDKEVEFLSFEPVHERGRLVVGHNGYGKEKKPKAEIHGKIMMTRVIAFDHLHQLIMQASSSLKSVMDPYNRRSSGKQEDFVLKTFGLSSSMVEKLKREVTSSSKGASSSCSSFELGESPPAKLRLCRLHTLPLSPWFAISVVKIVARTKALGIAKERMVCLQFTVDIRNKMDPPLPQSFSGNAFVLCSVASTAGEIINIKLTTLVDKIKEAKLVVNEEYIQAYLKALEAPQGELPPLLELTIVSDWQRMPYHQVDFFGRSGAIYVSPLGSPVQQVAFFMQRPGDVGGVDVRIGLPKCSLLAFNQYFIGAS
ncbi:Omega-hydroxypalmitate O-feruloyl transferase [Dendrobium catenatum]|uniref:Omega-hydroxypalmitate O-feruloyl transferase n=1 Tax=Dendrobium catenatum TaxID=906689 RepID=A0A2I0WTT4_9ASPA|nr:Omega-hydroxypalmitate O-feruloyl transferase [Dendrobium catenatum]